MARLFDDASSQYLTSAAASPVSDVPLTMAAWFRLKVTRDAASDDAAGDAELYWVEIRET